MKLEAARRPLILVTRPQEPGRVLAAQLRGAGSDALWWPAFDLLPPADLAALGACAAHLGRFDLVVFVSPAAVHAFAAALTGPWPGQTRIGAVGAATGRAARAALLGADRAHIVCPDGAGAADAGSESLWQALQVLVPAPQRVLIVRAQGGRQWLIDRLQAAGAQVEEAVAYRRVAHVPGLAQWAALRAGHAAHRRLALLYTSSEAVPVVAEQLGREQALAGWHHEGIALCVHHRIEQALRASGLADVRPCAPDAGSIRTALGEGTTASARTGPGALPDAAQTRPSRIS